MIVIAPLKIDDTTLSSSTVPEPDTARGEIDWQQPNALTLYGTPLWRYRAAVLAPNGLIYCVGQTGGVMKINPNDGYILTYFGSVTGEYFTATLAADGNIYCVGNTQQVMKIEPATDTISYFGDTGEFAYLAASVGKDGDIYCVGAELDSTPAPVVQIQIETQTVSTFSGLYGSYYCLTLDQDGFLYSALNSGYQILKIDTDAKTTSVTPLDIGAGFLCSTIDENNIIYFFGDSTKCTAFNPDDFTFTRIFIGFLDTAFNTCAINDSGIINVVGSSNNSNTTITNVVTLDTATKNIVIGEPYTQYYFGSTYDQYSNFVAVGTELAPVMQLSRQYGVGDTVIKAATHSKYQAITANSDDPEIGVDLIPPTWLYVSPTNKYSPFDEVVSTLSIGDSPYIMDFLPGQIIGGIAGINITGATSINVTMTDPVDGVVYSRDAELVDNTNIVNWFNYLWDGFNVKSEFVFLDLPPYAAATTTLTMTGAGDISIGALIIGENITLGVANHGSNLQQLDFSQFNEDEFGNVTVTKRARAKLVNFDVTVDKPRYPYVYSQLEALSGVASVWVGSDTDESDITLVYGYHRDNTLNLDTPTICKMTLQIRGLV